MRHYWLAGYFDKRKDDCVTTTAAACNVIILYNNDIFMGTWDGTVPII